MGEWVGATGPPSPPGALVSVHVSRKPGWNRFQVFRPILVRFRVCGLVGGSGAGGGGLCVGGFSKKLAGRVWAQEKSATPPQGSLSDSILRDLTHFFLKAWPSSMEHSSHAFFRKNTEIFDIAEQSDKNCGNLKFRE